MKHFINYGIAVLISTFLILCSYGHINEQELQRSWQNINCFLQDYSIRDSFDESFQNEINDQSSYEFLNERSREDSEVDQHEKADLYKDKESKRVYCQVNPD